MHRRLVRWWILSIVVHLCVLGALLIFSPFREWLWTDMQRHELPDPDQQAIDQMVAQLFRIYTERVRANCDRLVEIEQQMRRLSRKRYNQLSVDSEFHLVDLTIEQLFDAQVERLARQYRMQDEVELASMSADRANVHALVASHRPSVDDGLDLRAIDDRHAGVPDANSSSPDDSGADASTQAPVDGGADEGGDPGASDALDAPRWAAIEQAYNQSRALEVQVSMAYERIRAAELAGVQLMPLSKAFGATHVVHPRRDAVQVEPLRKDITSVRDGHFGALKRELRRVFAESTDMVAKSERLLDLSKGILGEASESGVVQWVDHAVEDEVGGLHFSEGRPYNGDLLLPQERRESPLSDYLPKRPPVWGVRLSDGGRQSDWMFLDSWYMIGPFEHPGRSRPELLDRKYPPESIVDLNASYLGKDNRILRWQWQQSRWMQIQPLPQNNSRLAVWYAFTQLWSDKPMKLWAAFGSDDYSVAWVNGERVFEADRIPHAWEPYRGDAFRIIRLRQGVNRILVKLENAGGTTGFSVIINTDPSLVDE